MRIVMILVVCSASCAVEDPSNEGRGKLGMGTVSYHKLSLWLFSSAISSTRHNNNTTHNNNTHLTAPLHLHALTQEHGIICIQEATSCLLSHTRHSSSTRSSWPAALFYPSSILYTSYYATVSPLIGICAPLLR